MSAKRFQAMLGDLQQSGGRGVLYLEGKTDTAMFHALLGRSRPIDDIVDGILVRAIGGGLEVRARLDLARTTPGFSGRFWGVLDGDGQALRDTDEDRLFRWPAYCLENLVVKSAWPSDWGSAPDWPMIFRDYAPYVAINGLVRKFQARVKQLGLEGYSHPQHDQTLRTTADFESHLAGWKRILVEDFDVLEVFRERLLVFENEVAADPGRGHWFIDGKWLVDRMVKQRGLSSAACLERWMDVARSAGGAAEVRALWQRIVVRPATVPGGQP